MKRTPLQRLLAWLLIALLGYPLSSSWARDTDIYRGVITASSAAEPNVLLVIDTSDSMNLPEGWREYPGGYDSHVEYLWNDLTTISQSEVMQAIPTSISTGNGAVGILLRYFYVYGNYPTVTLKNKVYLALNTAVSPGDSISLSGMPLAGLNGTFTVISASGTNATIAIPPGIDYNSPGASSRTSSSIVQRALWNNTDDSMTVNGGGTTLPAANTPLGYWSGALPHERRQIWQNALAYASATEAGDAGPRYVFRNYKDRNVLYWLPAGTPESDKRLYSNAFNRFYGADQLTTFGGRVVDDTTSRDKPPPKHLLRGGIDFGVVPDKFFGLNNQCQASYAALTPSTIFAPSPYPPNAGVYKGQAWQRYERYLNLDASHAAAYPGTGGRSAGADTVSGGPGLPIYYLGFLEGSRDVNDWAPGSAYWRGPLPVVVQQAGSYAGWTDLRPDWGGYTFVDRVWDVAGTGYANLNAVLGVYGANTAGIGTANDAVIAAFKTVQPPGYFDYPTSVNVGQGIVSKTRSCSYTGPIVDGPDAKTQTFSYGGTCTDGGISCSSTDTASCAALADPAPCAQTVAGPYFTRDYANCAWTGRQTLVSKTYSSCHWTNERKTVTVGAEGSGGDTYFVEGKCIGICTGPDCDNAEDEGSSYCVDSTIEQKKLGTKTYHHVLQSNGTNSITSGCANRTDNGFNYYYGGSCAGDYRDPPGTAWTRGTTAACVKTVTFDTLHVHNLNLTDVRTDSATAGCTDKVDTSQTCDQRHPNGCPYLSCASRSSQMAQGGTTYQVDYRTSGPTDDKDWVMVHDCVADEGASGPYMTNRARTFGAGGSPGEGRYSSAAGDSNANLALMYDSNAARRVSTAPSYDVYSTNYLNWKYGAKSNGNPIGRKSRLQIAKDALTQLVDAQNGVRLGLMVFNREDNTYNTEGGNIAYAVQRMGTKLQADIDLMSAADKAANDTALANRQALINKINSLTAAAQTPLSETLYEAYRYFRGDAPTYGKLTTTALTGGAVSAGCDRKAFDTPGDGSDGSDCLGNPTHVASSGNYHSPMLDLKGSDGQPATCQKNFVVMVSDGGPENDWSANDAIKALSYQKSPTEVISPRSDVNTPVQTTPYGQFSPNGVSPSGPADAGSQNSDGGYIWLDELAYYMANAKVSPASVSGVQTVSTYAIGFAGATTPVLQNAAVLGHGQYYSAEDPGQLYSKLTGALDAIKAWQPISGGGAVVPISALNRAENSDNVYLGFFGPSLDVRWDGSLKKYLLSDVTTPGAAGYCGTTPTGEAVQLCLTGQTALSNDIGETVWNVEWVSKTPDVNGQYTHKVNDSALSLWAPVGAPDGGSARKGGSGQMLIASGDPSTRRIYTFLTDNVSSSLRLSQNALDESNTAISKARLGNAGMTGAARATLINFARGGDPVNGPCSDASAATPCVTWRDWAHGDILHSKPIIFDYGNNSQYAFYLSSEGVLHAVSTADGTEKWAYTVEEALPRQAALMDNPAGEHIIVADGSPSIFFDDVNRDGLVGASDGDRVTLYFGQRRGGSAYYALDITDIDDPKFVWKVVGGMGVAGQGKRCVGANPCQAEAAYDELGQTWSFPGVGKVRAKTPSLGRPTPVLIVGGGYDPNQDSDPVVSADTMGRALFVIDGYSGAVVKKFDNGNTVHGLTSSIPSDAAAMNADHDPQNLLDRVYVGDTAGNLFRFDIDDASPDNWTGGRIAQLADNAPTKILFAPALVKQQAMQGDALVAFDAVYVGTGDREHPLKSSGTADKLFMIKDKPGVDLQYSLNATLGSLVNIANKSAAEYAAANTPETKGWYYPLPGRGEKTVSMVTVLNNVLRASTYSPLENINDCVPSGRGQLYGMDALSGAPLDPEKYKMLQSNPRIFAGFYSQGYIGNAVPIIFRGRQYVLQVTESGQILPGASSVGNVGKIYWYREAER